MSDNDSDNEAKGQDWQEMINDDMNDWDDNGSDSDNEGDDAVNPRVGDFLTHALNNARF